MEETVEAYREAARKMSFLPRERVVYKEIPFRPQRIAPGTRGIVFREVDELHVEVRFEGIRGRTKTLKSFLDWVPLLERLAYEA